MDGFLTIYFSSLLIARCACVRACVSVARACVPLFILFLHIHVLMWFLSLLSLSVSRTRV